MPCYISIAQSDSKTAEASFPDLVLEMKLMDIDVKPFFEIAARDISDRYGIQAARFAQLILDQMTEDNDSNGIYLWKELCHILKNHLPPQQITLH